FSLHLFLLSLIIRRPPISPLFPYTTLFRSGIAALSVATSGGKVISVTTTSGDVHPGAVVFATGIPPLLDGLPIDLPATKVKGHLLATEPTSLRLPGTVAPQATQLEDGRLLVGGTFDTGDETPKIRPEVIESILEA